MSVDTCNICLRSAPSLPLCLDQPVKHLLLDDLVVTGIQEEFSTTMITSFVFFFVSFSFFLINAKISFVSFPLLQNHLVHALEIFIHIQCL